MEKTAKLLTEPTNYAVVQLPGRNFPGVVFQSDSIYNLTNQMKQIQKEAEATGNEDLAIHILDILETLVGVQRGLENVCRKEGIELPYPYEG